MNRKLRISVSAITLATLLVPIASFGSASRAEAVRLPRLHGPAGIARAAAPALSAAEIFENLTKGAPSLTASELDQALTRFRAMHLALSQTLAPAARLRLDELVDGMGSAWRNGDRATLAIKSIEAYRVLVESASHAGQPVPVQVPLLDYAGFKLSSLMLPTSPDWPESEVTAREATAWWHAISAKVHDRKLRQSMGRAIQDINSSTSRKKRDQVRVAAKQALALVDDLESYFESRRI